MLTLLVAAAVLVTALASDDCTPVRVTMSTPGRCVDDPDFVDAQGYDCTSNGSENEIDDCWADNLKFGYSMTDVEEIMLSCPSICDLCDGGTKAKLSVEFYDYSTGGPPDLLSDSTFTGVGPRFDAPASAAVTQTVCLPTPSCFKIRIKPPSAKEYLVRAIYEVTAASGGAVIASGKGMASGDWNSFCLSGCPSKTAYDVGSGTCLDCKKGAVNEAGICEPCEAGTFLESGSEDAPAWCSPCPASFSSLDGATSVLGIGVLLLGRQVPRESF